MSAKDIDKVFATYPAEQRKTLEVVRQRILEVIPDAQQCIKSGSQTKSALHFPNDKPLTKTLVKKLVKGRLALGI